MPSNAQDSDAPRSLPFVSTLIATGLYSGFVPWASGTVGTMVGLVVYLIPGAEGILPLSIMIVAGFVAGAVTSRQVAAIEGHRLTKTAELAKGTFQKKEHSTPDPSIVVIDEIVGMWVALFLLPKTVPAVLLAFVAFRFFDIIKPPPARRLEHIPNGWGIMLDDVIAGIYANVATSLVLLAVGALEVI